MSSDEDVNPYELLDVAMEATEADIRKAYRTRSLKVHPDRNRNDPNAAKKFHELTQASELLLDPLRRLALDAKLRIKAAKKERFKSYDAKRKNMVEDLEERERAFKKAKSERDHEERKRWGDVERVKEEGRRMREERENEIRRRDEEEAQAASEKVAAAEEDLPPPLGDLDTTIRLKYTLPVHPILTTPASLSTLLSSFGQTDASSIVLSLKAPKKNPDGPKKFATALVPFLKIGDAFAAVCASGREDKGLGSIDITWAGNGGKEPEVLGWLRKKGQLGGIGVKAPSPPRHGEKAELPQSKTAPSDTSGFSSFPSSFPDLASVPSPAPSMKPVAGLDYESLTLMRLRQAERERLEREILEEEAQAGS